MAVVSLIGDARTTTSLALAATWPSDDRREPIVVELDPTGGSLAAWLDLPVTPSISSLTAALHHSTNPTDAPPSAPADADGPTRSPVGTDWDLIRPMIQRSATGVLVVPAPVSGREATNAVSEASRTLLPRLVTIERAVFVIDEGPLDVTRLPAHLDSADAVVITHRQDSASPRAAAVRLDRLADAVATLQERASPSGAPIHVAVIGDQPFAIDEIAEHVEPSIAWHQLAVDPLAAATFAGRVGVSERRFVRLPLLRSCARLSSELARTTRSAGRADALGDRVDTESGVPT